MVDHANRMRFRMLSKREPQPFRFDRGLRSKSAYGAFQGMRATDNLAGIARLNRSPQFR